MSSGGGGEQKEGGGNFDNDESGDDVLNDDVDKVRVVLPCASCELLMVAFCLVVFHFL